jgi:prepilin-type N-terminal cleavage/methylation domain-containing protein
VSIAKPAAKGEEMHQRYKFQCDVDRKWSTAPASKNPDGFTFMELLVVIGIIGILAALLLTALNSATNRARRTTCLNNLRQIALGVRLYSDDANDRSPGKAAEAKSVFTGYKELMKSYVGLEGPSSAKDRLFACPADVYYLDTAFGKRHASPSYEGWVLESWCAQSNSDYSSYVFNAGNLVGGRKIANYAGIAGKTMSSIMHPSRTVLVTEAPALIPFSWHQPKRFLYNTYTTIPDYQAMCMFFSNSMNMVSFIDGHVSYMKIYWQPSPTPGEFWPACAYDPPAGYDYQWSGN